MKLLWISFLFCGIAAPAHAFNVLQLADPAFQRFVLLEIPLASMLLMGLLDAVAVKIFVCRTDNKTLFLITKLMSVNLSAMVLNIALLAFLMFVVTGTLTESEHRITILFAVGYFMLAFIGFAWWKKAKFAMVLCPARPRCARLVMAATTLLGYSTLYYYIYLKMFAYPV